VVLLLGGAAAFNVVDVRGQPLVEVSDDRVRDSVVTASAPELDAIEPRIQGYLDGHLRDELKVAFRIADHRLRDFPRCSQLFDDLGADGGARLRATRYQSAVEVGGERICRRGAGVAAFTAVGNPRTIICPGFGRLDVKKAAVIVLHEALHFAGLPESPPTPGAMNSSEINDRIADRCGL
jgi:hypothetical protein